MLRFFVALNDADGDLKHFDESSIKDPEKIRAKFKEKHPPVVLYEEGDKEKGRIVTQDVLTPGIVYVWLTKKEPWEDREILQNAFICSRAVYEDNPFQYLKGGPHKHFHSVSHVIAVGDYKSEGKPLQRFMLVSSKNPKTRQKRQCSLLLSRGLTQKRTGGPI